MLPLHQRAAVDGAWSRTMSWVLSLLSLLWGQGQAQTQDPLGGFLTPWLPSNSPGPLSPSCPLGAPFQVPGTLHEPKSMVRPRYQVKSGHH